MAKTRKGSSIRDANDLDTVCRLRRDNFSTRHGHIYADEMIVSIGKRGNPGEYIDWYNREQKFVRK